MNSITVFNNKGGVGKTTLLCNLAGFLATKYSKKVLIIDADPQCNATTYLFPEQTIVEIYEGKHGSISDLFIPLAKGRGFHSGRLPKLKCPSFKVDVIPGDPKLALREDLLATDWQVAQNGDARGLQTTMVFLQLLHRCQEYDLVFFDLGPSLGAINRAVLLASEFFVLPMSSDIFSLQAIENIGISLKHWKKALNAGLQRHHEEHGEDFDIDGEAADWKLQFLGYVTQQYTAKSVRGVRQPVSAYDRIIRKIPGTIKSKLIDEFSSDQALDFELGQIPNLHSLIPLSQLGRVPIFSLKAQHGVVGAHFAKVRESEDIFDLIATAFLENLDSLQ